MLTGLFLFLGRKREKGNLHSLEVLQEIGILDGAA